MSAMDQDSTAPSTDAQPSLADLCQWWPMGGQPCYASAGLVLVRPSGRTLGFTCAGHREAWAGQVHGWLRIDPTFVPLKANPRFEKLIPGR